MFILTGLLLYLNWRVLVITQGLLAETIAIRKDSEVIRKDTRRVADSFEITVP
jgi:hypothetical protein